MVLTSYIVAKKFVSDFVKNETRMTAICWKKNEMGSYSTIYIHILQI